MTSQLMLNAYRYIEVLGFDETTVNQADGTNIITAMKPRLLAQRI